MKKYREFSSSDASLQTRPTPLASTAKATAETFLSPLHCLSAKEAAKEETALLIDFLELQSGYAA